MENFVWQIVTQTHTTHMHTSSEAEGNNSGDEKGVVENPSDPKTLRTGRK